jgi:predicted RecB family nuclease
MAEPITASMLYNLVQCPTRVERDLFGDPAERDEASPFVEMLWQRGALYEAEVLSAGNLTVFDLSGFEGDEKEQLTLEAMRRGEPLIYNGRIRACDLLGVPDLLRRQGGGYLPIDIKSGGGEEGGSEDEDGKPKRHYAVQLALYVDVLERLGLSAGRRGIIYDVHGVEVDYDLNSARGVRKTETLWDEYQTALQTTRAILARSLSPKGALAASCKQCHWHTSCASALRAADDLTLIPYLGRANRDAMEATLATVADLAACNPATFITKGKTPFKGVGEKSLLAYHARAVLLTDPNAKPYIKAPLALPVADIEFFFDIEVDPLRD